MSEGAVDLGDVMVWRVEEGYGPAFPASILLPSFDESVRDDHGPDTIAQFIQAADDMVLVSTHTWVVRTPQKTILVDTCTGNHKQPNLPDLAMLNHDWLAPPTPR